MNWSLENWSFLTVHSPEEPALSLKTIHSYEWISKTSHSITVRRVKLPRQLKNQTVFRTGLIAKKPALSLKTV
jgi:hypothetical protein